MNTDQSEQYHSTITGGQTWGIANFASIDSNTRNGVQFTQHRQLCCMQPGLSPGAGEILRRAPDGGQT